jgi:hypothetical protein
MTDKDKNDPKNGQTETTPLPESHYKVVEPDADSPYNRFAEANQNILSEVSAAAEKPKPQVEAPPPKPPRETWIERLRKYKENPVIVYGAIGLGLGILLVILIAIVSSLMGPPDGRYDLGPVSSPATGMNGRLFLQWDKKLQYRLTLEPSYADQQAEFALAVTGSQQPLSVQINLLDIKGFVLCSKDILLKYNPPSVTDPAESAAGKPDAAMGTNEQLTQGAEELQEAARERGKDLFENQTGADGRITAINAHGDLPCPARAYEKAQTWSFTTNFPSLAEQDELLKHRRAVDAGKGGPSAEVIAERKKAAAKVSTKLLPFSIEGDDSIVDFDTYHGTIMTRGRKTFFVDKTSPALTNTRWQDYPVTIHYRCDRNSECTLMNGGAGAMHARLAR